MSQFEHAKISPYLGQIPAIFTVGLCDLVAPEVLILRRIMKKNKSTKTDKTKTANINAFKGLKDWLRLITKADLKKEKK